MAYAPGLKFISSKLTKFEINAKGAIEERFRDFMKGTFHFQMINNTI